MKVRDFIKVVKLNRDNHDHITFWNEDGTNDYDTFHLDEKNNYINHQKECASEWGWLGKDLDFYLDFEVIEIIGTFSLKIRLQKGDYT